MTFEIGDRVRIIRYGSQTEPDLDTPKQYRIVGETATVVQAAQGINRYVSVSRDNSDNGIVTLCVPGELQYLDGNYETVEYIPFDDDDYALVDREDGLFDFLHKETGKVLLTTRYVSLSTLNRIAQDHSDEDR